MMSCPNNCCTFLVKPYKYKRTKYDCHKFRRNKAGVFFYDPTTERILLVQSRGMKWGPPKGSIESTDATIKDTAIREVYEETGIVIVKENLDDSTRIRIDKATYYYIEKDADFNMSIPDGLDNDASGITWVNVSCLHRMYLTGKIDLNSHCKKLIGKILKLEMK